MRVCTDTTKGWIYPVTTNMFGVWHDTDTGKRNLLDRVNKEIQKSNVQKARRGFPMRKPLGRNSIAEAVCIARRPGPFMLFEAGDLDELLVAAGFRPKK